MSNEMPATALLRKPNRWTAAQTFDNAIINGGTITGISGITASPAGPGTFAAAPSFSTGELLISTSFGGQNVVALQNTNTAGYSALTLRGDDGVEHLALGRANSASSYLGGNGLTFLEISQFNGTVISAAPPDFAIVQTGSIGGTTAIHEVMRLSGSDGTWRWKHQNTGAQTMRHDPLNGLTIVNGSMQVGTGGTSPSQVGFFDVYGTISAVFGSQTSSRSTDAVSTLNVADAAASLRIIRSGVFKASIETNASSQWLFTALDNSSKTPLILDYSGTTRAIVTQFRLTTSATPASASASGTAGDVTWDASFVYICTATNTWKRAAIATW